VSDLRKLAESKGCYLRLPGYCTFNDEQTILAHIRRGNTAGGGMKPADINGIPCCARCHSVYDGENQKRYTRAELDAEMLRAHCQWLDWLFDKEIVVIVL
jgi:hypothetical protein